MTQIPRDGRKYERTNERTNKRTNIRTYERKDENYIPLGINAGGIKIWGGGGGGGGGRVWRGQGVCEWRSEAFVKIQKKKIWVGGGGGGGLLCGGQGGCVWRSEAFVKIQKKNFF